MSKIEELGIIRTITEHTEYYVLSFEKKTSRICTDLNTLVKLIAEKYKIDRKTLYSNCEPIIHTIKSKYNKDKYDTLCFTIYKRDKNSEQIKKEIKEVTNDILYLIKIIISEAEKLRDKQDITEWIWSEAEIEINPKNHKVYLKPTN